jgi:hypothetical protein
MLKPDPKERVTKFLKPFNKTWWAEAEVTYPDPRERAVMTLAEAWNLSITLSRVIERTAGG